MILRDETEYRLYNHWEQLVVLMPLVNSEDPKLLKKAIDEVTLINNNLKSLNKQGLNAERFLQDFNEKGKVLAIFGRYPTRNCVLGRFNSDEEKEYLEKHSV